MVWKVLQDDPHQVAGICGSPILNLTTILSKSCAQPRHYKLLSHGEHLCGRQQSQRASERCPALSIACPSCRAEEGVNAHGTSHITRWNHGLSSSTALPRGKNNSQKTLYSPPAIKNQTAVHINSCKQAWVGATQIPSLLIWL